MKFSPGVVPQCPSSRGFDVLNRQGLAQQRIVEQVYLPDGEVVRPVPVRVEEAQLLGALLA
jgi:hypothetical protein